MFFFGETRHLRGFCMKLLCPAGLRGRFPEVAAEGFLSKGVDFRKYVVQWIVCVCVYMGVSLNGGTPISHPKMMIFSRKTHGFVGETHHFRKHPYMYNFKQFETFSTYLVMVPDWEAF